MAEFDMTSGNIKEKVGSNKRERLIKNPYTYIYMYNNRNNKITPRIAAVNILHFSPQFYLKSLDTPSHYENEPLIY